MLLHGLALAAALLTQPPGLALIVLALAGSTVYYLWRYRPAGGVAALSLHSRRCCELAFHDGRLGHFALSSYFLHPKLVILNFADGRWRRASVVVWADSAPPEQQRRLRRWLLATCGE